MKALGVLLLVVIAIGLGLFARAKRWIDWPPMTQSQVNILQVTGDPPITVSDGSLHAHSKLWGWMPDSAGGDATFNALAHDGTIKGKLAKGCSMTTSTSSSVSAEFWSDNMEPLDISPDQGSGLTITITHTGINVVVTVPNEGTASPLTVNASPEFFYQSEGNGNRRHKRAGEVSKIVIVGHGATPITWTPVNPKNPHFTLGFCYQ